MNCSSGISVQMCIRDRDEVANEAGVGRATLFRCYNKKTELAIAVCASKWKADLDKLDEARPISSIHDIPAIGRFIFTLDSYIGMYTLFSRTG